MIVKHTCLSVVLLLLICFTSTGVAAQPVLPDVAGTAGKGVVLLSWNCQYNGIKSITVMRSADSMSNFSVIGYVKKLDKGVQAFADGHPVAGNNFYKLNIMFSSGLTWMSNRCRVFVNKADLDSIQAKMPSNDSLQRYIVTEEVGPHAKTNGKGDATGKTTAASTSVVNNNSTAGTKTDTNKTEIPKQRLSISFDQDPGDADARSYLSAGSTVAVVPKKKIVLYFDDPTTHAPTFIKSRFIYPDPATGHIKMYLPDDVATHHYSVRFYNQDNHMIMEVPKINTAHIIIDRRNFQHKGLYKFVIRRDVTEFETGYINID